MLGIGRKNFSSSMIPVYLFLFMLITNHFLFIHSFVVAHNDQDQHQLENSRQEAMRRFVLNHLTNSEEVSSDNNNNFPLLLKPTVQRRFCCMSPLSGRKRSVRDLARKQQLSNERIE